MPDGMRVPQPFDATVGDLFLAQGDAAELLFDRAVDLAELDAEDGGSVGVKPDDLALDLDVVDRLLHGPDADGEGRHGESAGGQRDVAEAGAAEGDVADRGD